MSAIPFSFSNNQIDKLGERLKLGDPSDEDLTLLSAYRNSFATAANFVANVVRETSGLEVAVRSVKTQISIVAKLQREGVKQLSAMQDIGGCRITVSGLESQIRIVQKLMDQFQDFKLIDRVAKPSHGYRAMHLVVRVFGRKIEIQIRTIAQHRWAQLSERAADIFGSEIKYGKGATKFQAGLEKTSNLYYKLELRGANFQDDEHELETGQFLESVTAYWKTKPKEWGVQG